jgi:hypothetical protein
MVALIQGTWLYLSGIQADEAQLAIFDRQVSLQSLQLLLLPSGQLRCCHCQCAGNLAFVELVLSPL